MRLRFFVPGQGDRSGGGHAYIRHLAAALCRQGHDAAVVGLAGTLPLADDAARRSAAAAWHACPTDCTRVIDGAALAAFEPMLDAVVTQRAVALVHHPTALEAGFDEASHARLRGAEQAMLPLLPLVVATSDAVAQVLVERFNVDRAHIAVVGPGVDPAPRSAGSASAQCHILSVGALTPRKRHDVLLRALARLFDLDWHLTIVGTPHRHPEHAAALGALAGELGIAGQVAFAGEVEDHALARLWDTTDLFALATHWEATPWAAMQAFRHGVPVVIGGGGAAAACVTLKNGLVVAPGDAELMSKALRRVIFDRDLRAALADDAWRTGVALPDWTMQAEQLLKAIAGP